MKNNNLFIMSPIFDFSLQQNRIEWVKRQFSLTNKEFAALACVHPSQVSNWMKNPDNDKYQHINKYRAICVALSLEEVLPVAEKKLLNWCWLTGWNRKEKRKRNDVQLELVNRENIWDPRYFNPAILIDSVRTALRLFKKKNSKELAYEIKNLYQQLIMERIDIEFLEKIKQNLEADSEQESEFSLDIT